ncbi:MAG: hypothetical protein LAT65_01750 [Saccharospirillum sp.]|nr:hypothetical protein [Saccharospirillum sp.]
MSVVQPPRNLTMATSIALCCGTLSLQATQASDIDLQHAYQQLKVKNKVELHYALEKL